MNHRRNPGRLAASLAVLSLVLIVGGCGGDDDDAAPEPADSTAPASETVPEEPGAEAAQVDMVDISFAPADVTVSVGTTVVWTNQDGVDHTTTSNDGVWDSGVLGPGESFEFTFEEPGTYTYLCEIHPAMQGTIIVEG